MERTLPLRILKCYPHSCFQSGDGSPYEMVRLVKYEHTRPAASLVLVAVVLLASWMGEVEGGYFVGEWALAALILAGLALIASLAGVFRGTELRRCTAALGLFTAYAVWTSASLLWAPNRGDAWLGAGQTLLYLLGFWLAVGLISLGA